MGSSTVFTMVPDTSFCDIIVPTMDTVQMAYLLEMLLTNHKPVSVLNFKSDWTSIVEIQTFCFSFKPVNTSRPAVRLGECVFHQWELGLELGINWKSPIEPVWHSAGGLPRSKVVGKHNCESMTIICKSCRWWPSFPILGSLCWSYWDREDTHYCRQASKNPASRIYQPLSDVFCSNLCKPNPRPHWQQTG